MNEWNREFRELSTECNGSEGERGQLSSDVPKRKKKRVRSLTKAKTSARQINKQIRTGAQIEIISLKWSA